MGRPKGRIGRLHKNYERKRQALKRNPTGRPRKLKLHANKQVCNVLFCYKLLTVAEINIHISGNRMSAALHLSVILALMFHYYQVAGLINHQPLSTKSD